MKTSKQNGFSLIELLIVVVIIGVIAAVAVPVLRKGIWAAENGRAIANLRTINSAEVEFFSQKNRFARLAELQASLGAALGTPVGDRIVKGTYTLEMNPITPTDGELANQFMISATRVSGSDTVYRYELTQSGKIMQILPIAGDLD